jgi:hypothetical protein
MSQLTGQLEAAKDVKDIALQHAAPWIERCARFGYVAKGVVYVVVGGLAVMAALDRGGDTTGGQGAIRSIARQPFGQILLAAMAAGLVGYCLWQMLRAFEDPEHEGTSGKAIAKRISFFISGAVHASLAYFALKLLIGAATGSLDDDERPQSVTRELLSWPGGKWAVVVIGLIVAGYGIIQMGQAYKAKLSDQMSLASLGRWHRLIVITISRLGVFARGILFTIIGGFVVVAGWRTNPSNAKGIGSALRWVQNRSFGWELLMAMAMGLMADGIFMFVKAWYRRIDAC